MHDWNWLQWGTIYLLNWVTWMSYSVIPYKLYVASRMAEITVGDRRLFLQDNLDNFLFRLFIFLCGLHHLVHPPAMQYNWFAALVLVDSAMAAVSALTAHRAWRLLRLLRRQTRK